MNNLISSRFVFSVLGLAALGILLPNSIHAKDPLTIKIVLKEKKGGKSIDFDETFRVLLENNSDYPIQISNPELKNGFYQLSFEFTDSKTEKTYKIRKRIIDDADYWEALSDKEDSATKTITIDPNDSFAWNVSLSESGWGENLWTELPAPNSSHPYSITAIFKSLEKTKTIQKSIWSGSIESQIIMARFVSKHMKTPHQYLRNGFLEKALEIMKKDPEWISEVDESNYSPLHIAVRYRQTEVVNWLLKNKADINQTGENGFTPLHLASHIDVVELLLKHNPNFNIRCRIQGRTPLQGAVDRLVNSRNDKQKKKWKTIVDKILEAGAKCDIFTAIHLNDFKRVKQILKKSPRKAEGSKFKSPLRTAASLGRYDICKYLIEKHKVDVDDFEGGNGYPIISTALHYPKIVKLLIENNADLKTRITWQGGRTGIQIIGNDATALHLAANSGVPETINLLIDNGVDIFATSRDLGEKTGTQTALEIAATFGRTANVEAILDHPLYAKADPKLRQKQLDIALVAGVDTKWLKPDNARPKLIETLIAKGANPNAKYEDNSAVRLAAEDVHPGSHQENEEIKKVVAILVKNGAKLDLFSAVAIGDVEQIENILKKNPKSANSLGPEGYPALHFAVKMDYRKIIAKLIEAKANLEILNKNEDTASVGETALLTTFFWGRFEIAKMLIEAGADPNVTDEDNVTPLHYAVLDSDVEIVRVLLGHGAKMDAKDAKGKTPLDWLREEKSNNTKRIEKLFREFRLKKKKPRA